MKGFLKKTLACAIAVCALTSSTIAFAANGPKADSKYYSYDWSGTLYEFWARATPTVTKYNNAFSFQMESSRELQLALNWQLYQENTNRKIGNSQYESVSRSTIINGSDSASLLQWGNAYAECTHSAFVNATIFSLETKVTTSF